VKTLALFGALLAFASGCGSSSSATTATGTTGTTSASSSSSGDTTPRSLHVDVKLTSTAAGVHLFAQNGTELDVPVADIAGKTYVWATTPGGESPGNTKPLEFGAGMMPDDLMLSFDTKPAYPDGPWEMAFFISVSGGDPTKGPQATDLAAFSLDAAEPGEPPITGTTVRMRVKGADAQTTLVNTNFIRFTK
jgi:hypothetical protein